MEAREWRPGFLHLKILVVRPVTGRSPPGLISG